MSDEENTYKRVRKKKKRDFKSRNVRANILGKLNKHINNIRYDLNYKDYTKTQIINKIKNKIKSLRHGVIFKDRSEIMKRYNELLQQKYPRKENEAGDYY